MFGKGDFREDGKINNKREREREREREKLGRKTFWRVFSQKGERKKM